MNKVLIIDIEKRRSEIVDSESRKSGLFLGYELFEEYCSKDDIVFSRGALSGLIPGVSQCYAVFYNEIISTVNYGMISGDMSEYLLSCGFEAVVMLGENTRDSVLYIEAEGSSVRFNDSGELASFDNIQMKNLVDSIYREKGCFCIYSGNIPEKNLFADINITGNSIFNGCGIGNIFIKKGIKIFSLEKGKCSFNPDIKKEYFGVMKLFERENEKGRNSRSCKGCPAHCFQCAHSYENSYMHHIYYRRYNDILKDIFSEDFLGDVEKLLYIFKVFSIDFMGIIPIIKNVVNRPELMGEVGIPEKDRMSFMDIALFLKNLNLDNNSFYNLLRNDFESFRNNYCPDLEKTGIHYFPVAVTKKEKKLYSLDFYCSFLFDLRFDKVEDFLKTKALYEFFGICPNNLEIFDEYWVSRIGETVDSKFSNISRIEQYSDILLRYKYDVEAKYTGVNRFSRRKDEKISDK
ncbi:MAG: aldehyde ferredoxin oxidoreductase N-terminal domain-containing protein [Candidatus Muiribacteriaceae bacterium]